MKRKDGLRVVVKENSLSVQCRTDRTFSVLRLLKMETEKLKKGK